MRRNTIAVISLAAALAFMQAPARSAESVALKSGETTELGPEYWVANCRSILKGAMTVEILEGPPDVAASIREQDVLPRKQNCARPVQGGVLVLTAREIKTQIQAKLILRVKFPTADGERQKSRNIDLTLLP
jgi:hypothetical protein